MLCPVTKIVFFFSSLATVAARKSLSWQKKNTGGKFHFLLLGINSTQTPPMKEEEMS